MEFVWRIHVQGPPPSCAGVKRVVITGSVVALHALPMDDLPLQTPDSWNEVSTAANGPYLASKVNHLSPAFPVSCTICLLVHLLCWGVEVRWLKWMGRWCPLCSLTGAPEVRKS